MGVRQNIALLFYQWTKIAVGFAQLARETKGRVCPTFVFLFPQFSWNEAEKRALD